jgi:LysM repeat protein
MRARNWAIFVAVNVIVSAAVTLTVLFIWEHVRNPVPSTATPAATPLATEEAASLPTAASAASPATEPSAHSETLPEPLLYTVQPGDTLGAIAQSYNLSVEDVMAANELSDPHLLHPGQTLIIPAGSAPAPIAGSTAETPPEPTPAEALPTPLPTLTSAAPPLVEIGQVLGSSNLAAEVVVVRNRGGTASLEGWTLSDAEGDVYTFPTITLFTDAQLSLHSATGSSSPTDLYWGRTAPAWNGGALITLRDAAGNVVDTYIVP